MCSVAARIPAPTSRYRAERYWVLCDQPDAPENHIITPPGISGDDTGSLITPTVTQSLELETAPRPFCDVGCLEATMLQRADDDCFFSSTSWNMVLRVGDTSSSRLGSRS